MNIYDRLKETENVIRLSARLGVEAPWEIVKLHNVLLACMRAGRDTSFSRAEVKRLKRQARWYIRKGKESPKGKE